MVKTVGNSDSLIPTATAPVLDSTYFQTTIFQEELERRPLVECVVDGFAHEALRQVTTHGFQPHRWGPARDWRRCASNS